VSRPLSAIAPDWWDYTTLDRELIDEAARLTPSDLMDLSRPGFNVILYDTLEDFYLAEALEYINAGAPARTTVRSASAVRSGLPNNSAGRRIVNALDLDVRSGHFWGMDEWFDTATGREVDAAHPLSFERADRELCFNRINQKLCMPDSHLHFPKADASTYRTSWDAGVRCAVMQGGQGEVKHWAFNDPLPRRGPHTDVPPSADEYRKLPTRVVDLHPLTMRKTRAPAAAAMLPPCRPKPSASARRDLEGEKVSIWHAGMHDNPFGQRLTAFMIAKRIIDTSVPMSLLADHPNVQFNYFRGGIGSVKWRCIEAPASSFQLPATSSCKR
jgi:glucosamine-6-phosphate deaminase